MTVASLNNFLSSSLCKFKTIERASECPNRRCPTALGDPFNTEPVYDIRIALSDCTDSVDNIRLYGQQGAELLGVMVSLVWIVIVCDLCCFFSAAGVPGYVKWAADTAQELSVAGTLQGVPQGSDGIAACSDVLDLPLQVVRGSSSPIVRVLSITPADPAEAASHLYL